MRPNVGADGGRDLETDRWPAVCVEPIEGFHHTVVDEVVTGLAVFFKRLQVFSADSEPSIYLAAFKLWGFQIAEY